MHDAIMKPLKNKLGRTRLLNQDESMRCNPAVFLATLIVGLSQIAFSQQPMSKGSWSYKTGKPKIVNFDYGTELTAGEP